MERDQGRIDSIARPTEWWLFEFGSEMAAFFPCTGGMRDSRPEKAVLTPGGNRSQATGTAIHAAIPDRPYIIPHCVAVSYFVVVPMNALVERSRREPPADPSTCRCPECLSEIALGARRCAYCTAPVTPGA